MTCVRCRGMQKAAGKVDWNDVGVCRTLRKTYGLDSRQARICKSWRPVMQHVSRAAALAVVACQSVLQNRRWNCSSVRSAPGLTPELVKGWKTCLFVIFSTVFFTVFFFLYKRFQRIPRYIIIIPRNTV